MDNFYVYMYLRSKRSKYGEAGTPYYIGKGKKKRAFSKEHRVRPPQDLRLIVFIETGLSEQAAHQREKVEIARYGRIDIGTGCLRNLTDGGEGLCGHIPWNRGTRGKQVAWNKGKKLPTWNESQRESHRKGFENFVPWNKGTKGVMVWGFKKGIAFSSPANTKGFKWRDESRKRLSIAKTGKKMAPWTDERRAKVKAAWKAKWIAAGKPKLRKCRSNRYDE